MCFPFNFNTTFNVCLQIMVDFHDRNDIIQILQLLPCRPIIILYTWYSFFYKLDQSLLMTVGIQLLTHIEGNSANYRHSVYSRMTTRWHG
jgi:hypothetical protein